MICLFMRFLTKKGWHLSMDVGGENVKKSKIQENFKNCQEMVPKYQEYIEMPRRAGVSPFGYARRGITRKSG